MDKKNQRDFYLTTDVKTLTRLRTHGIGMVSYPALVADVVETRFNTQHLPKKKTKQEKQKPCFIISFPQGTLKQEEKGSGLYKKTSSNGTPLTKLVLTDVTSVTKKTDYCV